MMNKEGDQLSCVQAIVALEYYRQSKYGAVPSVRDINIAINEWLKHDLVPTSYKYSIEVYKKAVDIINNILHYNKDCNITFTVDQGLICLYVAMNGLDSMYSGATVSDVFGKLVDDHERFENK